MKKNEIIELNGTEYTLELNRDSFVQIDKLCNIGKTMRIITSGLYEYMDDQEIGDDFDINSLNVNEDDLNAKIEEKENALRKIAERAFYIWLYPNHKLNISQVRELLAPYLNDEEKSSYIGEKLGQYLHECIEMRTQYNEELKNLKAQTNKK